MQSIVKFALVLSVLVLLGGCEWIRVHVNGSEHGIDWGVGVPL
jgi:uncharacterized protein YceK